MKKIFIGFLVLFTLLSSSKALAVGAVSVSTKGPMISSVGISDYRIASQENNKIAISFSILNEGEVQSGVKYSIKLIKEINKSQFLVDEKVYDESLTLIPGANLKKEITYVAPSNLDGEYSILLTSRNKEGLIFGIGSVGKVKITSSTKGIIIMPETCKLSIPGEKNKYTTYNLLEGVDINATESLQLKCTAINTSGNTLTAKPSFETHFRTVYGEIVPHTKVEISPITFNAEEKKDISILLPKALNPQAYDVKFSLDYGNEKSNAVVAHYVIQGVSATIQNLSLDKDFYEKGDTAKMFFSWSQSADSFPGSRLGKASTMPEVYIDAKITNKYGLNCIEPLKQLLPTDRNTLKNDIQVSINRTCVDPQVSLALVDKDGNILDQKDFDFETSTREKNSLSTSILIALIILVLIIVLILVYIKNKKGKNGGDKTNTKIEINIPVAIFALLFAVASLGINYPISKTESSAIALDQVEEGGTTGGGGGTTITGGASTGTVPAGLAATISLNLTSYDPNTPADITTAMYYTSCTNVTRNLVATGYITGNGYTGPTVELFNTLIQGLSGNTQVSSITVPATPGDYTLNMTIKGYVPILYIASDMVTTTDEYGTYTANTDVVSSNNFDTFKSEIFGYLSNNHFAELTVDLTNGINNATDISQINSILSSQVSGMSAFTSGGELSFTKDLSYSPVQVRGVDVTVNDSKNPTITQGGSVEVKWAAVNSTYGCKCTFSPAINGSNFCGLSAPSSENNIFGSNIVNGVSVNTTFNVSCKDYEQTQ